MALLSGAVAALGVLVFVLWRPWQSTPGPTLQVAVLEPVVRSDGKNPDFVFIGPEVMEATVAALTSLEGLQLLDPPERNEGKEVEAKRLSEADEVILPRVDCRRDSCQVILHRRKPDSVVLAVSRPFEVQSGFEDAYQLREGVGVHVQQIYFDRRPRSGSPGVVKPEDYSVYMGLKRQTDRGKSLDKNDLDRLDALLKTSPGLIGAYVLAMGGARSQGDSSRALDFAAQAEKLAPYDPRPLFAHLRTELEGNRLADAPKTLERLERLAPGDIRVKIAGADLSEAGGKLKETLNLRKEVAERRPTWRNILKLATLEFRLGKGDSARRRLEDLLTAQPGNHAAQERVAAVEMLYGDLQHAATLYEELIRTGQAASYLPTNLGFVRYLLGEYAGAEEAYRQYLSLAPKDLVTRFNLATALEAKGDLAGARRLYRVLTKEFAAAPAQLDAHTRMLHAQCLVRLDHRADAARIAGEVLEKPPEDIQDLHQAAQVYALLGETVPASFYADQALKKGLQRAWFTIPEFRSLEKSSEFQKLLDRYTAGKPRVNRDL